jgi:hypothetical protein
MPSGIYPIPPFHQNAGESPPAPTTLRQRLKSWWQRNHLDEQLTGGADQDASGVQATRHVERSRTMGFLDRLKGPAESAQATTSKVGAAPSPHHIALAHRAKWLMSKGVDTPAHIDSMISTGIIDKPGGTEYMIALTVSPAVGEAYAVTTNQYVYPSAPLSEGEDVTVKVDPDDRDVVWIFGKT